MGRVFHLTKFGNAIVANNVIQAMVTEQAKMMNEPANRQLIDPDSCPVSLSGAPVASNEALICQDENYNASSTDTQAKFNLTDARAHLEEYCNDFDGQKYPAITDNPSALRKFYDNGRGVWVELWSNINTKDESNCKVGEVVFKKADCITALQDAMSKCRTPSSDLTTGGNAEPFNCANFGFIGNDNPPETGSS